MMLYLPDEYCGNRRGRFWRAIALALGVIFRQSACVAGAMLTRRGDMALIACRPAPMAQLNLGSHQAREWVGDGSGFLLSPPSS